MEFPMTNTKLQNIANSLESYLDEKYIDNIVNQIKMKIISVAYSKCEQTPRKRNQRVALGAGDNPLISRMHDTVMDKKLSIQMTSLCIDRHLLDNETNRFSMLYMRHEFKSLVAEIISKVQQLFPEMKITVDPLETYILFDWS